MAEIDIVPKHRSPAWVWIVIALVVIALAYWFFTRQPNRTTGRLSPAPTVHASLGSARLPSLPVAGGALSGRLDRI
jgi:bacteriorhodopsin